MLPIIPKPPITPGQKKAALAVAGIVDVLQIGVFPLFGEGFLSPLQTALDILAAVILMGICGFKWQFVLAFLIELLPIVDIFPTWAAVVLMLPSEEPRINVQATSNPTSAKNDFVEVQATLIPPIQPPKLQNSANPVSR